MSFGPTAFDLPTPIGRVVVRGDKRPPDSIMEWAAGCGCPECGHGCPDCIVSIEVWFDEDQGAWCCEIAHADGCPR